MISNARGSCVFSNDRHDDDDDDDDDRFVSKIVIRFDFKSEIDLYFV